MTYRILVQDMSDAIVDKAHYKEVEGEPLTIKDFPELKLAIRQETETLESDWQITELVTGMGLGQAKMSRQGAILSVRAKIKKLGIKYVLKLMETNKAKYGVANGE
jgi:hypothetical protein